MLEDHGIQWQDDDRIVEKWINSRYIPEVVLIGCDNGLDLGENEETDIKNNI